jgi:hypothetical protein
VVQDSGKSFHRVMGDGCFVEVTPEHEMINNG